LPIECIFTVAISSVKITVAIDTNIAIAINGAGLEAWRISLRAGARVIAVKANLALLRARAVIALTKRIDRLTGTYETIPILEEIRSAASTDRITRSCGLVVAVEIKISGVKCTNKARTTQVSVRGAIIAQSKTHTAALRAIEATVAVIAGGASVVHSGNVGTNAIDTTNIR
jgi:hypothetical protein